MAGVASIPGMKDFFGKKLGSMFLNTMSHLSPIDLHAGEMATKIATAHSAGGDFAAAGTIFSGITNAIRNRGSYKVGDWFRGANIGENIGTLSEEVMRRRQMVRIGIPAVAGAAAVSRAFMPDTPLDTMASGTLQIGTNFATAAMLGRFDYRAGMGYSLVAGYNMLRPGNNWGPF